MAAWGPPIPYLASTWGHSIQSSGAAPRSVQYFVQLGRALSAAGLRVDAKVGGSPDDAFAYMASAANFLPGPGGFSRVVARLVKRRCGRVFGEEA